MSDDEPLTPRAERPRRSFTAEYKLRVLAEYDPLHEPGARGGLLRREGLYSAGHRPRAGLENITKLRHPDRGICDDLYHYSRT